jgi:hypothetical protein
MTFQLPPIAKTAERLLLEIEQAVAGFPRKHRYTAGEELRKQAMGVTVLVHRAWRDRKQQLALIERVVWEVDALKIRMQLYSRLRAFASLGQFEMLARIARELGKQAGGWLRQQKSGTHPTNGQSAQGSQAHAQRAEKLSTRGTSSWEVYR